MRAAAALLCLGLGGCFALALAPKALKALALLLLLCLALRQLLHLPQLCIACGRGQAYLGASCFRSVLALASRVRDEDKVIMTVKVTGAVAAPPIKVRPAPRGMFMAFTAPLATCHLASLAFVLCLLVLCLLPFTVSLAAILLHNSTFSVLACILHTGRSQCSGEHMPCNLATSTVLRVSLLVVVLLCASGVHCGTPDAGEYAVIRYLRQRDAWLKQRFPTNDSTLDADIAAFALPAHESTVREASVTECKRHFVITHKRARAGELPLKFEKYCDKPRSSVIEPQAPTIFFIESDRGLERATATIRAQTNKGVCASHLHLHLHTPGTIELLRTPQRSAHKYWGAAGTRK